MAIPSMRQSGWGRIVNVSTRVVANPSAMIGGNTYTFAKSALESHTHNLAAELNGSGVTANIYRPEWIRRSPPPCPARRGKGAALTTPPT